MYIKAGVGNFDKISKIKLQFNVNHVSIVIEPVSLLIITSSHKLITATYLQPLYKEVYNIFSSSKKANKSIYQTVKQSLNSLISVTCWAKMISSKVKIFTEKKS